VSGSPEPDLENRAALAACDRPPRFTCIQPRDDAGTRALYRCRTCGGVIGESQFAWYSRGIIDGRAVERRRAENRRGAAVATAAAAQRDGAAP
jgi:hypothetical protein